MSQCVRGLLTCASGVLNGFVDEPRRGRLREVVCEFGEARGRYSILLDALDGLGEAAVQAHSTWRAQFPVKRLPYQRVRECEPTRDLARLDDHLRP